MKIYTKTGDQGTTSLFSGQRVPKNHPVIEALGSVDESNAALGWVLALLPPALTGLRAELVVIQHALFDMGAVLATPYLHVPPKRPPPVFESGRAESLERWIDAMDSVLPPLTTFILPGGDPSAAALHVARTAVRRVERLVAPLSAENGALSAVLIYLNRLSDYLFVAARFVNQSLGIADTTWQPYSG